MGSKKVKKLRLDSSQEVANELSADIKKDALQNAEVYNQLDNNISEGQTKSEMKYENFLEKEAKLLD